MFHDFMFGRYYPVRSKIHFMNPLSKLLCVMIFVLMTFFSTTIELNLFLMVLTILILSLTNISLKLYAKSAKILIPFYLLILLVNAIFKISFLDTVVMMIRLTLVFFYITMLTLTTPPTEIIYGLEKILGFLKLFRINVSNLALSITMTIRFLPNMIDESNRILKTQASRGIEFYSSNLQGKILALRSMIVPAFILTVKKSEDLKRTMALRLYSTKKKRTNFRMNHWNWFDSYIVMMHLLILFVIIKKEFLG